MSNDAGLSIPETRERQQTDNENDDILLLDAVRRRDPAVVEQALWNGANVNCVGERIYYNRTVTTSPLFEACRLGDTEIVRILLNAGANARWKNSQACPAINQACREGHLAIVEMLLDNDNGLLEIADNLGNTPLFFAIQERQPKIVRFLVDRGANIHATRDKEGFTTLMIAGQFGNLAIVQLLLAAGVDVEARDGSQRTALHHAAEGRDPDIVQFLLDQAAFVHATSKSGTTTLMTACYFGNVEVTRLLLDAGVDLEARDGRQQTALHHAACGAALADEFEVVHELILRCNANMCAVDRGGETPFDVAVSILQRRMGMDDSFDDSQRDPFLEMYGKRLTTDHGQLALHVLLRSAKYSFDESDAFHPPLNPNLKICLPLGKLTLKHWRTLLQSLDTELIRSQDQSGKLPIHIAGRTHAPIEVHAGLVELDSATLQIADHSGALPAHACCSGLVECSCLRYLVEQGGIGTLSARNHEGALPLHILCRSKNPPLAALQYLIQSFPGSVKARTNAGQYPFMIAACNLSTASLSVVYELVRASPDLVVARYIG